MKAGKINNEVAREPSERPMLFTGEMVRAILAGRKFQTRRIGKFQKDDATEMGMESAMHARKGLIYHATYRAYPGRGTARRAICEFPYGVIGDRIWVRENFAKLGCSISPDEPCLDCQNCRDGRVFQADDEREIKWTPSIYMPRWASRLTLEIVEVWVERLQDIGYSDAIAEGIEGRDVAGKRLWKNYAYPNRITRWFCYPKLSYKTLWESINGVGSWAKNPWVWVIGFKRLAAQEKRTGQQVLETETGLT